MWIPGAIHPFVVLKDNLGNRPRKLYCPQYIVADLGVGLNHSKFGLNFSNRLDGCPRVSTEILMSGTPLLVSEQTRLLNYYKKLGVVVLGNNYSGTIQQAFVRYDSFVRQLKNELSFDVDVINRKNVEEWLTF